MGEPGPFVYRPPIVGTGLSGSKTYDMDSASPEAWGDSSPLLLIKNRVGFASGGGQAGSVCHDPPCAMSVASPVVLRFASPPPIRKIRTRSGPIRSSVLPRSQ